MEEGFDPDVIKRTQESLGKFVKRPPLTDKLLKKPPFRFLHDIITTVIKTTGFFDGLFDETELNSENVKDKEAKINFLNKVIIVLNLATGEKVNVKPTKIIAGQEAEKTNELLHCLGKALSNKINSKEAVEKYKKSISKKEINKDITKKILKDPKSEKKTTNPPTVKDKERLASKVALKRDRSQDKSVVKKSAPPSKKSTKPLANAAAKNENSTIEPEYKTNNVSEQNETVHEVLNNLEIKDDVNKYSLGKVEKVVIIENNDTVIEDSNKITNGNCVTPDNHDKVNSHDDKKPEAIKRDIKNFIDKDHSEHAEKESKPESVTVKLRKSKSENKNEKIESKLQESKSGASFKRRNSSDESLFNVRPPSSRPGAPRVRSKLNDVIVADEDQTTSVRVNVIIENEGYNEDDGEELITVDVPEAGGDVENIRPLSSGQHGTLVQQILDTQKEYNQKHNKKTEIEYEANLQKSYVDNTEELRHSLEAISRSAAPLGRIIEQIRHHTQTMKHELKHWNNMYDNGIKQLNIHRSANEETLIPLHAKIKQLDQEIEEYRGRIDDMNVLIYRNSQRIDKLLQGGKN